MTDFLLGLRYSLSGFRLIGKPGIRLYVVTPLLINTVLFAGAVVYGASAFSDLMDWMSTQWAWLDWLAWLLWPVFFVVVLALVFFFFSMLANLLAAPFNGFLAAAVEQHLAGQSLQQESPVSALPAEIARAIGSESKKIAFFLSAPCPWQYCFSSHCCKWPHR
jgi:CysZ protein